MLMSTVCRDSRLRLRLEQKRHRCALAAVVAAVGILLIGGCRRDDSHVSSTSPVGGADLFPVAEGARSVVVGRIDSVSRVDDHAYLARLDVERVLRGKGEAGARINISWEELARGRAVRFQEGDRVLVALMPLPQASIWDRRFLGGRASGDPLAIAAEGRAYVRHPRPLDVDLVATYLALSPEKQRGTAGRVALSRMIAQAADELALSSLVRLQSLVETGDLLDSESRQLLEAALLDGARPLRVRKELIAWVRDREVNGLKAALEQLAARDDALQAEATAALGGLAGGLAEQRIDELLGSGKAELRAIGARFARSSSRRKQLAELIENDPAAEVRAAAAQSIIAVAGIDAFADVIPALGDRAGSVQLAAVDAVVGLGAAVVEPLTALARDGRPEQAIGAILALDALQEAGKQALMGLAVDHPDERIRRLALLALGKMPGHH
jgi:hypothetical protein